MSLVKYELMVVEGFNAGEHISISVGAKLSPLPGEPGGVTNTHWVGEAGGSGVKGHATASVRHTTEIGGVRYTFSVDAQRVDGSWRVDHDFRRELGAGGRVRPVLAMQASRPIKRFKISSRTCETPRSKTASMRSLLGMRGGR